MPEEERTTRLMQPWGFDRQDLDANRSGRLSERQLAGIMQNRQRMQAYASSNPTCMLGVLLVAVLVGGGLIILLMSQTTGGLSSQMPVLLVVIAAVVVLVFALIILSSRRLSRSVEAVQEDPVDLLSVSGTVTHVSFGNARWGYGYGVEVQGVHFTLPNTDKGQNAFVEGETYRIYYVTVQYARGIALTPEFMSAEAI
jgi:hypothetical protein